MNLATIIPKEFAARDAALIVLARQTSRGQRAKKYPGCYPIIAAMAMLAIEIAKPATVKIMPKINPFFAIFLF
jgi:hypothetical protein